MRKILFFLTAMAAVVFQSKADVTLDECLRAANNNYPLIKQYDLLTATEAIELSDINKAWLPKLGLYAQGTIQNVVPAFPAALSDVMQRIGGEIRGLDKLQYKVGVDINQTVWDGGASRWQREITRQTTEVDRAAVDVDMYAIRQRVESIYFGILLLQSQIEQVESAITVYDANLDRLRSMVANGTAMRSDADMVEAQLLTVKQQLTSAQSATKAYRNMLSIFTGLDLTTEILVVPEVNQPLDMTNSRPELALFKAQEALNDSRKGGINATLMPKVGFFAQSYYGYPGIDYFKSMMGRELTFNIVAGVKVSWNIDAFYTRKNALQKIEIANQQIDTQRSAFLFNTSMQSASQIEEIRGIEAVISDDAKIVALRKNVRAAAESQLRNGVIDATALTTKINDETQASLNAAYHAIQRLQAIYNLKNTLNQ